MIGVKWRPVVVACLLLIVVGCSGTPPSTPALPGTSPDADATPGPLPDATFDPDTDPANSSQALIGADLEAGVIDLGTSLQYRAWALFHDGRLPEKYDGNGSLGEDQALIPEIRANLDTLPEEQKQELARFLLRPSDPQSAWSSPPQATGEPAVRLAAMGFLEEPTPGPDNCRDRGGTWWPKDWSPDGSENTGFRIWACSPTAPIAEGDFQIVIGIASRLWPGMTYSEPDGMGLPIPDTNAPVSDGNGKVDVYLVEPFARCRQRGSECQQIDDVDTAAVAVPNSPEDCVRPGFPVYGCSGYMVLNRTKLREVGTSSGGNDFSADFAHEFFHILQFAHNGKMNLTWYHEASAVWAEWFFDRDPAKEGVYDRFKYFQKAPRRSLLWYIYNSTIQYEAWGWPLFQSIEEGPSNVFQTWVAVESVLVPQEVDKKISEQLGFGSEFRNFAVRDAQPAAYIHGSSTGLEDDEWQTKSDLGDFPSDPHALIGRRSTLSLGKDEYSALIDPLAAQYDEYQVLDPKIREIKIDISKLKHSENADLDVLIQLKGSSDKWSRFKGGGGKVTLCRDQEEQNVEGVLMVIVSNHANERLGHQPNPTYRLDGQYTIESKDECEPHDLHIGGRIDWNAQTSVVQGELQTQSVSGSADVIIHVVSPYLLLAEREDNSTYNYDYSNNYNCAASHESGTLESYAGQPDGAEDWDYSIAALNPGGPLGQDWYVQILMPDYCGPSMQGDVQEGSVYFNGFPDCEPTGDQLIAKFDGVENYVIDCEVYGFNGVSKDFGEVSGHVHGVLHPLDGPHPTPPY